ncbi:MAG: DNA mismatch repair protein MutS [Sediminibacterium sp. Gen4]|jgi:DNA mismatch repair protein MutS2|uniref:endonuclease MutS2 n=1 Tax=unclassified Sediminibacterium TaxID=2635961 RepID=UPI0015BCC910|nr:MULTISPECIES: DNA mismatch repair protein MutS [unclassified Sediminibacterium]MBW0163154.1 DNA mismatch repair protein MutS [Sediminibacterium sp.]NWK67286.1 DNA mismatch repair protein MutS [Sediminibacterium sp. Gen4]
MRLYPETALTQLEFDKVRTLLESHCKTLHAREKAMQLRIHTRKEYIQLELQQTFEFKSILQQAQYFPNDFTLPLQQELRLLAIPGALITGEQWLQIRKLSENTANIFRWFDTERRQAFPAMAQVIKDVYYEKTIIEMIDEVIDEQGNVKDNASPDLQKIRMNLYRKRNELRRMFEKVIAKLAKAGYTADIDESFSNGRRVVAVFSEHKRQVKGILHGESDSRKTSFIEPEETIDLNNTVFALEHDELKEVQRILRQLTARLSVYAPLLSQYLSISGEYDFIRAKAKLAIDMNGQLPELSDKAHVHLINAYHPLLLLYNKAANKPTIPVSLTLDEQNRILVISGPNAGGKTVTMKTIGLNQLLLQSGLLVPVSPDSQMGIFKQLFIHIGDTQNLEFELSTYSSHLLHMKSFIESANGKTLFFIDELGSGSDPNLGGAFAEVIMEELARKHSFGVVTTHYLNLKVMANHTKGIINGAMQFDEVNLQPMYKLIVGKPGSSYTFAIAERIGLPQHLINRARKLVEEDHFKLDRLLNRTEQDLQQLEQEKKQLHKLLRENDRLKKEMEVVMDKERHRQQVELLKQQNRITEDRLLYLKDMERKLKQIVLDWKKSENKQEVIKNLQNLLFKQKETIVVNKLAKKVDQKYKELNQQIVIGTLVKLKKNYQVGEVKEIRGKKAIVQIGLLPMHVDLLDLIAVEKVAEPESK